ncbi:MAG: serine hydrolase domain-containing protein [Acidimicrobiia bacterium]
MESLKRDVQRVASETGFSGVVQVDDRGDTTLSTPFGFAHRGFEIPNALDTQFAIASGVKGFTALVIVSLINDGMLGLDTTARSLLGDDLPLIANDVTVEHLLAHTSGIGDYIDEEDDSLSSTDYLMVSPVHQLTTTESFMPELEGHETKFPAGERFSYCNGGFMVLALIAERASGVGYHDLIAQRVLDPAGLDDTRFLRSDEASGRMAVGYLARDGLRSNVFHLPVLGNGDGGIYTTATDMHRFWTALDEGRIVPKTWVAEMTTPRSTVPDESARYGLGFWLAESGPAMSLIGGDAGVSFTSSHNPTAGTTWTVLSNTPGGTWPMAQLLRDTLG